MFDRDKLIQILNEGNKEVLNTYLSTDDAFSIFKTHYLNQGIYLGIVQTQNLSEWLIRRTRKYTVEKIADDLGRMLKSEEFPGHEVLMIQGIRLDQEINLGEDFILVQQPEFSNFSEANIYTIEGIEDNFRAYLIDLYRLVGHPPYAAIKIRNDASPAFIKKDQEIDKFQNKIDELINISNLLNIFMDNAVTPFYYKWQIEEPFYPIDSNPNIKFPSVYINRELGEIPRDNVKHVENFYSAFKKLTGDDQRSLIIAAEYINKAKLKNDPSGVVELMTAMEAIFLNDHENAELCYRLSLRAALFAGDEEGDRENVRNLIKQLYDDRSRIVHGSKKKKNIDMKVQVNDGIKLISEICRKILQNGKIPNWKSFELKK